jgi:hypothetical protein
MYDQDLLLDMLAQIYEACLTAVKALIEDVKKQ